MGLPLRNRVALFAAHHRRGDSWDLSFLHAAARAGRAAVASRTYDEPGRAKKLKKKLLARADDAMRPFFEEVVGVSAAKGGGVDDADADGGGNGGGAGDGFEE